MFIINFTKLIKIWKNLKNRVISINKLEPEKNDDVEITIKGKFKGEEEDMSKPPEWFKVFETKINQKITESNEDVKTQITKLKEDVKTQITKLKEDVKTQITKLKEDVETKINQKITKLKEYFDTKIPKWFKDWNEKTFIPFKEKVEKDIVIMKKDIVNIKKDITAIKNTPTMKRELGLS